MWRPSAERPRSSRSTGPPPAPAADASRSVSAAAALARRRDAHMEVVVVVGEGLDDPRRPGEAAVRSHEDLHRAGGDEAVDELLRQLDVHLHRASGRPLPAVTTRVVEVGVEAVLVRDVAGEAVARAEVAALGAAE